MSLNLVGVQTLYMREVKRFVKVWLQTIIAPCVSSVLFMTIFILALGRDSTVAEGVEYAQFLLVGLVTMTALQNAFANTSSSLIISKVTGSIFDILMPPISAGEFLFSYVAGAVTRGLITAILLFLILLFFVDFHINSKLGFAGVIIAFFYAFLGSTMLATVGILTGLWANKFDHTGVVTNFIIMPLSFLAGTFYSIKILPGYWELIAYANPIFYVVDGMRYGLLDYHEASLLQGLIVLIGLNTILLTISYRLLKRGYKLKS